MASDTYLRNFAKELVVSSPYKILSACAAVYGLSYEPGEDPTAEEPEEEAAKLDRLVDHLRTHKVFIGELRLKLREFLARIAGSNLVIQLQAEFDDLAFYGAVDAVVKAATLKFVDDSEEGELDAIRAVPVAPLLHVVATVTPGSTYAGWQGVDIMPATDTPGQPLPLELALREAIEESVTCTGVAQLARRHLGYLLTDNGEAFVRTMNELGEAAEVGTELLKKVRKLADWLTQQFTTEVLEHMHAQAERGAPEGGDLAEEDAGIQDLFNDIETRRKVQTFKAEPPVVSGAGSAAAAGSASAAAPDEGLGAGEDLESGRGGDSKSLYAVALMKVIHTQKAALTATLNKLTAESTEGGLTAWFNPDQDLSTRTLDTLVKAMAHAYPCLWMPDEKRTAELVAEDKIRYPTQASKETSGKPYPMAWDGELGHEMFSIGTEVINFVMAELMDAGLRVRCDVDTPPLFVRLHEATEEATGTTEDHPKGVKGTSESKGSDEPEAQTKDVKGTSESKGSDEPVVRPQDCKVYVWKPRPDRCAVLGYAPSSMLWVHETKHTRKSHNDVAKVVTAYSAKARFDWAVLGFAYLCNGDSDQYREWLSQLRTTLTVLSENTLEVLEGSVSHEGVVTVKRVEKYDMLDCQQAARAALKLRALGQGIVDTINRRNTVKLMHMLEWCATLALKTLTKLFTLLVSSRPSAPKSATPDPSSGTGGQTPGPPGGGTDPNHTGQRGSGAPNGGKGCKPASSGGHRSGGRRHSGHVRACTDEAANGDHNLCEVHFQGEDQTPEEDARIRKACFDMLAMLDKGVKVQVIPGLYGWRYSAKLRRRVTAPACSVFLDDMYPIVYKVVKSSSGEDDMQRRMHEVKGSRVLPVNEVIELSKGRKAIAMPFTHTLDCKRPFGISSIASFIKCGQQLLKALQSLHEAGYYHRDIKPANLANSALTDVDLVLLDVGLAVHFPTASKATLLQRTGTEGYMAPELGSQPFSAASEVYSAGIALSKLWANIWDDEGVYKPEALAATLDAMTEADSGKRPSPQQLLASSFFACEEMQKPAPVSPESGSPSSQVAGQASPTILFTAEPHSEVSQ